MHPKLDDRYSLIELAEALRDMLTYQANIHLRPYQIECSRGIIESVFARESAEIAILMARQSGKTETVADTLLALCTIFPSILKQPLSVGIFAPARHQAIHVFRRRFYKRCTQARSFLERFNILTRLQADHFALVDIPSKVESRVRILSGAPHGHVIGDTFDVVLIEQVENMDDSKMINDIFPMLSTTAGVRILSGTPSLEVKNNYFYDVMTRPERQRPPWGTNPKGAYIYTVDWKEASQYAPRYEQYVLMEADRIGVDSDEFRATYNIEWIVLRNKFISRPELEALRVTHLNPTPHLPHYSLEDLMVYPRFAGWDPARGEDRSVMTMICRDDNYHNHILEWREFQGLDWEPQLIEATEWIRHWSPSWLLIDTTGEGDPIGEFAQKYISRNIPELSIEVEGYKYTSRSKSDIGKLLDNEMHQGRIHYPIDTPQHRERSHFLGDFLGLERNYKGNYLNLDHPQRSGCHNDYCTSLELALWASLRKEFKAVMKYVDII